MQSITALVGVYDADGGLRGELSYLAGRMRGHHCSLCDVTHSPIRRRREWDDYVDSLPVPFEVVHRNERNASLAVATEGHEPCVVALVNEGRYSLLLTADDIAAAATVAGLARAVDQAMTRRGLAWPLASA